MKAKTKTKVKVKSATKKDDQITESYPFSYAEIVRSSLSETRKDIPKIPTKSEATPALVLIPVKDKQPELIEILRKSNFLQLQEYIFALDVSLLASKDNTAFWSEFLGKFSDLVQREKITENILDKISVYEEFQTDKTFRDSRINHLKAKSLMVQAENILDIILQNPKSPKVLSDATTAVSIIESSYSVYQKLLNLNVGRPTEKFFNEKINKTHEVLYKIIASIEKLDDQFELLELALVKRQSNFLDNKLYLVDLLIKLGNHGTKLTDPKLKLKAIEYSELAYNIIHKQSLDEALAHDLYEVLVNLKILFGEFGDQGKKILFSKHINYLTEKFSLIEHKKQETKDKLVEYVPIITHGLITYEVMQIKKQIQETVLDKIQLASAKAKWTDFKLFTEYGVLGYLGKDWLMSKLGSFANDKNYKIAQALCFEAINIGIMNSSNPNPLCAIIFCQKYPEIIEEIIKDHPEYFVDGSILKVSYLSASSCSERLIGKKLTENDSGYNKYCEAEMGLFITNRIQDSILSPLAEIIKKGEWSELIEYNLTNKLTTDYISKVIGNNLSQMPDVFSIVRIIAFKQIVETTKYSKSVNFTPIKILTKIYPELLKRIVKDHTELVTDETVKKYIQLELSLQDKIAHEKELIISNSQELEILAEIVLKPEDETRLTGDSIQLLQPSEIDDI